ncbi:hypothetical protein [Aliiroseovarius marinus]|uniref:hypothetical protein n=1 Tax=Aliiroseovarius marinus TaxID=2500159 RepID=UPI003D7CC1C1
MACGDALNTQVVSTLMGGEQARMVFSDPPYNVPIDGHVGNSGKIQHREFAMASGEMSSAEFTGFLRQGCGTLQITVLMDRSIISAWTGATCLNCWTRVALSIVR